MTSALHYQIMRFFFVLITIFTLLSASFYLSSIAYPFLIGLGIAYIINRTVNFFNIHVKYHDLFCFHFFNITNRCYSGRRSYFDR